MATSPPPSILYPPRPPMSDGYQGLEAVISNNNIRMEAGDIEEFRARKVALITGISGQVRHIDYH